ncbi:hypothetical protein Bhyg_14924 [Pseudolycoriella hygida]|uniref:Uncharacterized protein n=1 Tax=Pseudolycoriella hygida TaxID=35572 RepID=A0A9Q0MQW5_9DIPT|nr:hypothetical protein Bhyg_14924 [Pseudolycoriella hygida]
MYFLAHYLRFTSQMCKIRYGQVIEQESEQTRSSISIKRQTNDLQQFIFQLLSYCNSVFNSSGNIHLHYNSLINSLQRRTSDTQQRADGYQDLTTVQLTCTRCNSLVQGATHLYNEQLTCTRYYLEQLFGNRWRQYGRRRSRRSRTPRNELHEPDSGYVMGIDMQEIVNSEIKEPILYCIPLHIIDKTNYRSLLVKKEKEIIV